MNNAISQYKSALKARRTGSVSDLGPDVTFLEVKPDFYADSRILSEDALKVFKQFRVTHPPYGLVDARGDSFTPQPNGNPRLQLMRALRATGHAAFDLAEPSTSSCPYHEVLAKHLGGTAIPLHPVDHNERGLDTLRNVATPGAELNAVLFVSLIGRLPAIQRLHNSNSDHEAYARNSVSLLREPLGHPQQWAAGFVYSLGSIKEFLSPDFLNDELALRYTKVEDNSQGAERLAWAVPTEEFTLRQDLWVKSRVLGSETQTDGLNKTRYPIGTRLGDIATDEATIGCPGNQLAFAMWDRVVDVFVGEDLWQQADKSLF